MMPWFLFFLGLGTSPFVMQERQLTFSPEGHTLHHTQVFSPDDRWIVFDSRNQDDAIIRTGAIRMVNTQTGETRQLYRTENQTEYGPGVGAATFSPVRNRVLFIHGIRNAGPENPYGMTRRTGVAIDTDQPGVRHFLDARNINAPFTPGALRGGTHAHTWSADGQWISFTYNDYILEQLGRRDPSVHDLRTVGVMVPAGPVHVPDTHSPENNDGELFSVVVTRVTDHPAPGSDEIDKAFDEAWIGRDGYVGSDGKRKKRAIAFQGNVRTSNGETKTEVFVVDLPDDLTQAAPAEPLQGTATTRPGTPAGVQQRRVTFTEKGVRGLRHWLRTLPDGSMILFLSEDEHGHTQVFGVSPNGGKIRQLTFQPFSVQTNFQVHPDGTRLVYGADNGVFVTRLSDGTFERVSRRYPDGEQPVNGVVWSNDGKKIAFNRYVAGEGGKFLQIFLLE
jgi:hypothetical protein